jgi:hypothetical protein
MRYFFDIHLHGETDLDDRGQEFRSLKQARAYVIASGRVCLAESTPRDRAMLHQCVIEITNVDGASDLVPLADCLLRCRSSRHLLLQAA